MLLFVAWTGVHVYHITGDISELLYACWYNLRHTWSRTALHQVSGGSRSCWWKVSSLPSFPLPSSFPLPYVPFPHSPSPLLLWGPYPCLLNPARGFRERRKLPQRVWAKPRRHANFDTLLFETKIQHFRALVTCILNK